MNVVAWSPFREFEDLFNRYNRVLGGDAGVSDDPQARTVDWRPVANISETANEYLIKAELPEISRDNVEVNVHDGVLTIRGERRFEKSTDNEQTHRVESVYGRFSRSFSLPENIDESAISAVSKDGVLTVRVPKTEEKKPKSIEIKVK